MTTMGTDGDFKRELAATIDEALQRAKDEGRYETVMAILRLKPENRVKAMRDIIRGRKD